MKWLDRWFSKPTAEELRAEHQAFETLADGLEELMKQVPAPVKYEFERSDDWVNLHIPAATNKHRKFAISGGSGYFEYELGSNFAEPSPLTQAAAVELLAACQAVIRGRVKEVRDRDTGVLYHIYRLKSHGLDLYRQDSSYSLMHYLHLKVRRVRIHSIPPITAA